MAFLARICEDTSVIGSQTKNDYSAVALRRLAAHAIETSEQLRLEAVDLQQRLWVNRQRYRMRHEVTLPPVFQNVQHVPLLNRAAAPDKARPDDSLVRRQLAEQLHDDVAQLLALCEMRLSTAGQDGDVQEARRYLRSAIGATRSMIKENFRLPARETRLLGELKRIAVHMADYGLAVDVSEREMTPNIASHATTILCGCVRELLFNVVKHAGVGTAEVDIGLVGNNLSVRVTDRGRGFSAGKLRHGKARGGFGLAQVRQRLADIGGSLVVESHRRRGTTATSTIPRGTRNSRTNSGIVALMNKCE